MPHTITVTDEEWQVAQNIYQEYKAFHDINPSDSASNSDEAAALKTFKSKYGEAVQVDAAGNLIIKRIITKLERIDGESRRIPYPGVENIQHTFLVTPNGNITAFGRSDEGATLGHGAFGTVKAGIFRTHNEDGTLGTETPAAIKAINTHSDLGPEIEALRAQDRLLGDAQATFTRTDQSGKPYTVTQGYVVDKLLPGKSLETLTNPTVTLPMAIRRALDREELEYTTKPELGRPLTDKLNQYTNNTGDSLLNWRLGYNPLDPKDKLFSPWAKFDTGMRSFNGPSYLKVKAAQKELQEEIISSTPSLSERCALAIEATQALQRFHKSGQIHNDVKGANFLGHTTKDPKTGTLTSSCELIDFGTRLTSEEANHPQGKAMGTPEYIAPESFNAPHKYSEQSDIHSLGHAFKRDFDVDKAIKLSERMKAKNPEDRPNLEEICAEIKTAFLKASVQEYQAGNLENLGPYVAQYFPELSKIPDEKFLNIETLNTSLQEIQKREPRDELLEKKLFEYLKPLLIEAELTDDIKVADTIIKQHMATIESTTSTLKLPPISFARRAHAIISIAKTQENPAEQRAREFKSDIEEARSIVDLYKAKEKWTVFLNQPAVGKEKQTNVQKYSSPTMTKK